MTITAVRQVTSPDVGDDILTSADVGKLIVNEFNPDGVSARTVSMYRHLSNPGGRYASMPFPEPAGHLGRIPYWKPEQVEDIKAWAAARPGTGSGATGRPRREQ